MKKIKDWSRVIGFVERAGRFAPSNENSQVRFEEVHSIVMDKYHLCDAAPATISREEFEFFKGVAEAAGYKVMAIRRGLNR